MEFIDKYIEATNGYLGVYDDRYGVTYAVIGSMTDVQFIFECMDGDHISNFQIKQYLGSCPTFPEAGGRSASNAIHKLNSKIELLYGFSEAGKKISMTPKVEIKAAYDRDNPEEAEELYDVVWRDVLMPLVWAKRHNEAHFFDFAKDRADKKTNRDLFAAINALIPVDINQKYHAWMHS